MHFLVKRNAGLPATQSSTTPLSAGQLPVCAYNMELSRRPVEPQRRHDHSTEPRPRSPAGRPAVDSNDLLCRTCIHGRLLGYTFSW
jgi:hypothetical protein